MAHICKDCGRECFCNGDIDPTVIYPRFPFCYGCGCIEVAKDHGWGIGLKSAHIDNDGKEIKITLYE